MTETASTQPSAAVDPDLDAGQVVGEYQVEGKLGQGGFGAVFKGVHPLIGKVVAIKVLARKFSVDPEMVSRFVAEARAVNQIRHRNIIDIFSFGQLADGRHYYVMEYLEGEPLDALIERDGRVAPEVALPILRQVARALDAAHAKGIAHRDLKPENVFLGRDPDGEGHVVKLLDFGIAKLLASDDGSKVKTRTGIPIGTPYYMSPEQCRGKDVDHRTDYYAFGIVTYRLLTGTYPIDADDYMSILMKQIADEPRPPSQVNPALPPGLDAAIAWLMNKDPAQRPPNLVTAVKALEEACESGGIPVPHPAGGWDATTPSGLPRQPTPQPGTAPTLPAQRASTPHAFAETMPSGMQAAVKPAPRRLGWILGGAGAVIAAGVVVFALRGGHRRSATPAPGMVQPSAAPPAGTTTPVAAPIDAAVVAPAEPATAVTPDAAVVTPPKKPKRRVSAPPPRPHDSHSIEDPFR